ncbi:MAG: substrate-binding domain-containing protein, partial [Candidatus Adiutrix sp.]|nr:substrate-binding domain-containing protein [Candidatus Adiutrix sp.]
MRTFTKLLLLALVATLLIGAPAQAADAEAKKFKLAYIARAQGDSFAAWLANAVSEEVEKNYPDMEVTVFDGQSNTEDISGHIENATINKFDAILLQPFDVEANRYPLLQAVEAGLVGACVNVHIPDPRLGNVDANPYDQAAVNAKLALTQIPQNGNVVVLLGPAGNPHALGRRDAWQKEFFDKRPDVKIVGEQIA